MSLILRPGARGWLIAASLVAIACAGKTTSASGGDGGAGAIGDPCVPASERYSTFGGFLEAEVALENNNPTCASGLCLADHFRGLTTCPYGLGPNGAAPQGGNACISDFYDDRISVPVAAQCVDRPASKVVTCTCRCANVAGRTDDGATYCTCPSGFTCAQVLASTGANDKTGGGYCIAQGTTYDRASACAATCDVTARNCGPP